MTSAGRALAVEVSAADAVAGAMIALDGQAAAAWLLEPDGSWAALVGGTLSLTEAGTTPGSVVSGTLDLDGEVWVLSCAEAGCGSEPVEGSETWEPDPAASEELPALPTR